MMASRLVGLIHVLALTLFCTPVDGAESWAKVTANLQARPLRRPLLASPATQKRFVSLTPAQTGIDFTNRLDWNHPRGLLFDTGYACGGIAVGDIDGNGLPDLFFAGGMGRSRLYFQESPWQFVEKAKDAGILNDGSWETGAVLLDIDNDGDLDLYVCSYDSPNRLYVNRGEGVFEERASEYGLDVVDACLMPAVADYDRDGDLDIYLAVNRYLEEKKFERRDLFYWHHGRELLRPDAEKYFAILRHPRRAEQINMWKGRQDRLLRNEGPGRKFVDVSEQMGLERGDTLSATWWDYDHDGWPDLYVCNDMSVPDRLFHNQRDGSFKDVALQSLPHTPWFAMGSSAGDINNDGLVDLLAADMSFRTHFKDKVFMGEMSGKFRRVDFFPQTQLMRNALFVNTGTAHFQEAAHLAGLASTDWTWSAKLADLDNDGRVDGFFTNGSPVNLAHSGETEAIGDAKAGIDTSVVRKRYSQLPPVLEQNLAFQNQGDLHFADRSQAWGLDFVGMSFGAVHADLDRDGDLDLVVTNLEHPPLLYRNDTQERGLLIQLQGKQSNRFGVGAELTIETEQGQQVQQVYPVSGFQACHEPLIHFGLGKAAKVAKLTVRWPSGIVQEFENLEVGQFYVVEEGSGDQVALRSLNPSLTGAGTSIFLEQPNAIAAEHHEEAFDDFARQPLLPNKLSQLGPPLAQGDIDDDGDDDLFLGEGQEWMGMLYLNQGNTQFTPRPQVALARDAGFEDSAASFFDANGDGHLDLYVGSGSVECEPGDIRLRDRLYLGDGTGRLERAAAGWLPDLRISVGAVAACDFDHDGDEDLVVGGRSIPGEYPLAPEHALLLNAGNRLENKLAEVAPELATAGMITAAVWTDVDGDGWEDLVVAVDWGPVRLYLNRQGKLVEATENAGLNDWTGWWQSLVSADLDNDGDFDLVAGNFGLNTKYKASVEHPVLAFYGEYGNSGQRNLIEASYEEDVLFPVRGKSCSSAAMPHLLKRFSTYEQFAKATLTEIYTPECLQQAERFEVNTLASCCFLNDGTGRFTKMALPSAVQLAPVFAIAVTKVNRDKIPDLFFGQNFNGPQRETGPLNGGVGVLAIGQGDGTFTTLRADEAGVVAPANAMAVATVDVDGDGWRDLCVATNAGPLRLFRHQGTPAKLDQVRRPAVDATWAANNLLLARQFLESEQFDESLPYLRRALKVSPHDAQALLMYAVVQREQGQFGKARELLRRIRTLQNVEESVVLCEEGRLFYRLQQFDRAEQSLRKALWQDPALKLAQVYLGDVMMEQGRLAEARQHYRQAAHKGKIAKVKERSEVARVLHQQGLSSLQQGQEREALHLFQRARRLDAQQPERLKQLATLLETAADEGLRDHWLAEFLKREATKLEQTAKR